MIHNKKTPSSPMHQAIRKAQQGILKGQTPFGCAIAKGNQIAVVAHNRVWATTDITAHAEITAIRLACKKLNTINLKGWTLYTTCEPCPMCLAACHWAGLDKIVYGASIRDAQKAGFRELTLSAAHMIRHGKSPLKLQQSPLRKECQELFTLFVQKNPQGIY